MSHTLEIEARYKIIHEKPAQEFLKNFPIISSKKIDDTYFDTTDGTFYQKGVFIRLRNHTSLDIKFNPDDVLGKGSCDHSSCFEYNFPVPFSFPPSFDEIQEYFPLNSAVTFDEFLSANYLKPLVILNKKRTTYDHPLFLIMIDQFENFGTFIEIEAKNPHDPNFMQHVNLFIQDLPLTPMYATGYVALAVNETNPDLYKKGLYFL